MEGDGHKKTTPSRYGVLIGIPVSEVRPCKSMHVSDASSIPQEGQASTNGHAGTFVPFNEDANTARLCQYRDYTPGPLASEPIMQAVSAVTVVKAKALFAVRCQDRHRDSAKYSHRVKKEGLDLESARRSRQWLG